MNREQYENKLTSLTATERGLLNTNIYWNPDHVEYYEMFHSGDFDGCWEYLQRHRDKLTFEHTPEQFTKEAKQYVKSSLELEEYQNNGGKLSSVRLDRDGVLESSKASAPKDFTEDPAKHSQFYSAVRKDLSSRGWSENRVRLAIDSGLETIAKVVCNPLSSEKETEIALEAMIESFSILADIPEALVVKTLTAIDNRKKKEKHNGKKRKPPKKRRARRTGS